jgi:uncharacterized protein
MCRAMSKPLLLEKFNLPTATTIDAKLLTGGAIFGAGWGLSGLCPAPAIANMAAFTPQLATYLACMVLGMQLDKLLASQLSRTATSGPGTKQASSASK